MQNPAFKSINILSTLAFLAALCVLSAHAQAAPKPTPYSLPFQLRPVVAATVIRTDTAFAFYEGPTSAGGTTVASSLLGSFKLSDQLAPLARVGVVQNAPPVGKSATNFLNPVLGATYAIKPTPELRVAFFLGVALPVGSGGGNSAAPEARGANSAGSSARSAMDNAMFAVNYFTVFPGLGFAYVANGFTAQVEATVLQLSRVQGEKLDKDSSRTNFTGGLHLGYFVMPQLSLGAELRHQRWLSTPTPVRGNSALRDTSTVAVGPRAHFKLSETAWIRPALALTLPLDEPMSKFKYTVIQLDIPVIF